MKINWYAEGKADRMLGSDRPALTAEDFFRDIEDPQEAAQAAADYERGFRDGR
jgi:hypothetical protein